MSTMEILQGSVQAILSCGTDPGRFLSLGDCIHVKSLSVTLPPQNKSPQIVFCSPVGAPASTLPCRTHPAVLRPPSHAWNLWALLPCSPLGHGSRPVFRPPSPSSGGGLEKASLASPKVGEASEQVADLGRAEERGRWRWHPRVTTWGAGWLQGERARTDRQDADQSEGESGRQEPGRGGQVVDLRSLVVRGQQDGQGLLQH